MANQAYQIVSNKPSLLEVNELLEKKRIQLFLKRGFDIFFSITGLIILTPVFILIGIMIKLDSNGSVFFKQERVGKNEYTFKILKFRTMVSDAEKRGMQLTVGEDNRITKVGQFLRKYKIDELPQIINVLIGDMSFVGPRPEVPKYVKYYDTDQKKILKIKPGITDLASIEYRDESTMLGKSHNPELTYINEIMGQKIELNLIYINNMSILFDIRIILRTIQIILHN